MCLRCKGKGYIEVSEHQAWLIGDDCPPCPVCQELDSDHDDDQHGETPMNLKDYPSAIAKAAKTLQRLEGQVWEHKNELTAWDWQIENTIASDVELKNEQQRKAKRLELQMGESYQQAREKLHKAEAKLEAAQIHLTMLRDTFRIEILETRERIARLEADRMIA
ncbi:hypothetical protein ACN4EG_21065 [Alkalinema pantanalense CENA528]|uniref:hypothetical protein n=1 Tax=Alkalinema pantanalense TaxID=1620705 RepID=UPI003D6F2ADE